MNTQESPFMHGMVGRLGHGTYRARTAIARPNIEGPCQWCGRPLAAHFSRDEAILHRAYHARVRDLNGLHHTAAIPAPLVPYYLGWE